MTTRGAMLVVLALVALSGCLRPRYADFVSKGMTWKTVELRLTRPDQTPLANVPVEWGEGKSKVKVTTDADGRFVVPVDSKQVDENPVLVVNAPKGVSKWQLVMLPPSAGEPVPVTPAPVPPTPKTVDRTDGGTISL